MTAGRGVFAGGRGLAAFAVVIALGLVALQGCGRKGAPEVPEGSQFPRQYPSYPDLPK